MNKLLSVVTTLSIFSCSGVAEQEHLFPLEEMGSIKSKHANEITSSNWSIGAETMDRGFTRYDEWKHYLGPLGFKKARIQSGWMKTEPEKGGYQWDWLDHIIFDMKEQGVTPWISLSYGNPLYCTFTGDSRGDIPRTPEAKKAWANYVSLIVERYKEEVNEWEIWNEPRMGKGITPEEYGELVIQTAEIVKKVQPTGKVIILALDHAHFKSVVNEDYCFRNTSSEIELREEPVKCRYPRIVMDYIQSANKLDLVDFISFHPYEFNPDEAVPDIIRFRVFAKSYSEHIDILQGECGAPSEKNRLRALADYEWTELSQAKWSLRRLLNDLYLDVPSSYFSIADMVYNDEINRKGLLLVDEEKQVVKPKRAYYALQHLASIFDDHIGKADHSRATYQDTTLAVHGYKSDKNGLSLFTIWNKGDIPNNDTSFSLHEFQFENCRFENPVYVDLITGGVYDIPKEHKVNQQDGTWKLTKVPVPDYPVVIADISLVDINDNNE